MLELAGILAEPEALHELDEGDPVVSLQVADIRRIAIKFGFSAERPILGCLLGVALISTGIAISVVAIPDAFLRQSFGINAVAALGTAPVTALLGLWLCRHSLRKGYFLHVLTACDSRKFSFRSGVTPEEIHAFFRELRKLDDWKSVALEFSPTNAAFPSNLG